MGYTDWSKGEAGVKLYQNIPSRLRHAKRLYILYTNCSIKIIALCRSQLIGAQAFYGLNFSLTRIWLTKIHAVPSNIELWFYNKIITNRVQIIWCHDVDLTDKKKRVLSKGYSRGNTGEIVGNRNQILFVHPPVYGMKKVNVRRTYRCWNVIWILPPHIGFWAFFVALHVTILTILVWAVKFSIDGHNNNNLCLMWHRGQHLSLFLMIWIIFNLETKTKRVRF